MHEFVLPDGLTADLTLIFNAGYMSQEELNRVVAPQGIVLINEWHGGATYMRQHCPDHEQMTTVKLGNATNDLHVFKRSD